MQGEICGIAMVKGAKARFVHRLAFGCDIDCARGIVADENDGNAGRDPVLGFEPPSFRGHTRAQSRRKRSAVDDAGGHRFVSAGASRASSASSPSASTSLV